MPKTRLLFGALTAATFGVASLFAAAPAYAATLPSGQKITVLDYYDGQFYDAHPETAALAPVGTGNASELEETEVTGIDVDDDGFGYAVSTWYPEGAAGAYLFAADANTGVLDYIDSISFFFDDFPVPMDECTGIDYSAGEILLACMEYGDGGNRAYIGTWDWNLGMAIPLVELTGSPDIDPGVENPNEPPDSFDYRYITALAVDPISGLIYVFTAEAGVLGVYTASEDAGLTFVTDTNEYAVYGADFDRSGQAWVTTYRYDIAARAIEPGEAGLATVNLVDGSMTSTAAWPDQEVIEAITVWGKEVLPVTGPANPVVPVTAAAIALLAGAILAGVTVLRRRSEDAA